MLVGILAILTLSNGITEISGLKSIVETLRSGLQ